MQGVIYQGSAQNDLSGGQVEVKMSLQYIEHRILFPLSGGKNRLFYA